jgi:hypothetical protein
VSPGEAGWHQKPAHARGKLGVVGLLVRRNPVGQALRQSNGPWAKETGTVGRKLLGRSGPPVCLKRLCLAHVRIEADPRAGSSGEGAG